MLLKKLLLSIFSVILVSGFNINSMDIEALKNSQKNIVRGTIRIMPQFPDPVFMPESFHKEITAQMGEKSNPNDVYNIVDFNRKAAIKIPTKKLFGCNHGSVIKINCNDDLYYLKCQTNPLLRGKDFAEQFNYGVELFIKNPNVRHMKEEAIQQGLVTPDGKHCLSEYQNETAFRQKMIHERSNGVLGAPSSNLTRSVLSRQLPNHLPNHFKQELDKKNLQLENDRKNIKFIMDNPGHGANEPVTNSSRGGCIIL